MQTLSKRVSRQEHLSILVSIHSLASNDMQLQYPGSDW